MISVKNMSAVKVRKTYFRLAQASKPTSAAILLLAYSIRMGPRSEESRKEPCSAAMTCAAQRTSWYSMKATGDPLLLCMRRRQKPGKLCNKNTTCAAQCQGATTTMGGARVQ